MVAIDYEVRAARDDPSICVTMPTEPRTLVRRQVDFLMLDNLQLQKAERAVFLA